MERSASTVGTRRFHRVIAVVTLVVAAAWAYGAHRAADHVRRTNFTRMVAAMVTGGGAAAGTPTQSPLQSLLGASRQPTRVTTAPAADSPLRRYSGWVEGIATYWERTMYVIAAGLGLVALGSLVTRQGRLLHLAAAGVMLAATVGTLVCMWMLMTPRFGDLPALSPWTFVLVAVAQSIYAVFLLIWASTSGRSGQA